jgi:hypothetical protein
MTKTASGRETSKIILPLSSSFFGAVPTSSGTATGVLLLKIELRLLSP